MECDDYVVVTSDCVAGADRAAPQAGWVHRLLQWQIACDCFACPSFLPAPPNYRQFHLVMLLGPKMMVDARWCQAARGARGESGRGGEL